MGGKRRTEKQVIQRHWVGDAKSNHLRKSPRVRTKKLFNLRVLREDLPPPASVRLVRV